MNVSILLKVLLYEALYHNVLAEVWADADLLKPTRGTGVQKTEGALYTSYQI